jgi:thioredoxin 1
MDVRGCGPRFACLILQKHAMTKTRADQLEIISSDDIDWKKLFLENEFIVINYQPQLDCKGCREMNNLFQELSLHKDFQDVKFLWVDSRNNPVAEQFIAKTQSPFIAVFKEGFLVECDNIHDEQGLRSMLQRLFEFKFKL